MTDSNSNNNMTTTTSTKYLNNASNILPYTVNVSASDCNEQLIHVATTICPFLLNNDENNNNEDHSLLFSARPLTGGLSNELFVVEKKNKKNMTNNTNNANEPNLSSVLIRIIPNAGTANCNNSNDNNSKDGNKSGNNNISIMNYELENQVSAWLSLNHVGPKYYGRFYNGRVEEFYENHIPLSYTEMSKYIQHIANNISEFHTLDKPYHILKKSINNKYGDIWNRIDEWIHIADQLILSSTQEQQQNNNNNNNNNIEQQQDMLQTIKQEWEWVKSQLMIRDDNDINENNDNIVAKKLAIQFCTSLVLTHMDAQSLNFLKHDQNNDDDVKELKLIDFEYTGINYRVIDFSNTFVEHCDMNNLKPNYDIEYPTIDIQNSFIEQYIQQTYNNLKKLKNQNNQNNNNNANESNELLLLLEEILQLEGTNDYDLFLSTIRHEIGKYTLISHLGWCTWSLIQNYISNVSDFDYIHYAIIRMNGYYKHQEQFFHCE